MEQRKSTNFHQSRGREMHRCRNLASASLDSPLVYFTPWNNDDLLNFKFLLQQTCQSDKEQAIILQIPVENFAFANGRAPVGSLLSQPERPPRQPPPHRIILQYPPTQEPCGTLAVLYEGYPVQQGPTHELRNEPLDPRQSQPANSLIRSPRQQ